MILATVISVGPNHLENKNCPDHFLHLFGCQAASKFPSNPQCVTWSHRLRVAMCRCSVFLRERLSILVYALQLYSFPSTGGQENKQEPDTGLFFFFFFFWPVIAWLRNLHADFVVCLLGYWLTANFNLHPLIHKTLNKNIQLNAILPGSIFELSHEAHWYRL